MATIDFDALYNAPAAGPAPKPTKAAKGGTVDFDALYGETPPTAPAAEPSSAIRRYVGDPAITLLKGAIGVPESAVGLANLVTGGRAGKFLENKGGDIGFRPGQAKEALDEYLTPEQKAVNKKVSGAEGFVDTVKTAVQNPSSIAHAALESAPSIVSGGVVARGVAAVAPKIAGWAAAGIGEGAVSAGQSAEQVRQQTDDGLLTGKQSALAAGSGALTGIIGGVAGKVANKLGIGDIDQLVAGFGASNQFKQKGIVRRITEGFATEGILQELPQSAQEQIAQNVALGKPWDEGVANAAAMGALTGGVMGSAVAAKQGSSKAVATPSAPQLVTDIIAETGGASPQAVAPVAQPAAPQSGPTKSQTFANNAFAEFGGTSERQSLAQADQGTVALSLAQIEQQDGKEALAQAVNHLSGGDAAMADRLYEASQNQELVDSGRVLQQQDAMAFIEANESIRVDAGLVDEGSPRSGDGTASPQSEPSVEHQQAEITAVRDGLLHGSMVSLDAAQNLDLTGLEQGVATGPDGRQVLILARDAATVQDAVQTANAAGIDAAYQALAAPVEGKAVVHGPQGSAVVDPTQAHAVVGGDSVTTVADEIQRRAASLPATRPAAEPAAPRPAEPAFHTKAQPAGEKIQFTQTQSTGRVERLVANINRDHGLRGNEKVSPASMVEVAPPQALSRVVKLIKQQFGTEVVFFNAPLGSVMRENGNPWGMLGGVADRSTGAIYINTRDGASRPMLNVLGHELTHILERSHPDVYDKLEVTVLSRMREKAAVELRRRLSDAITTEGGSLHAQTVRAEAVAEGIGEMAEDPAFWRDVFSGQEAEQGKTLFQSLIDVLAKMQRAMTGAGFMVGVKDFATVRKAATEAFRAWSEKTRTQSVERSAADLRPAPAKVELAPADDTQQSATKTRESPKPAEAPVADAVDVVFARTPKLDPGTASHAFSDGAAKFANGRSDSGDVGGKPADGKPAGLTKGANPVGAVAYARGDGGAASKVAVSEDGAFVPKNQSDSQKSPDALFSRDESIIHHPELFKFKRGVGRTLSEVAKSVAGLRVTENSNDGRVARYTIELNDGNRAGVRVRQNPNTNHPEGYYGYSTQDADPGTGFAQRPGDNAELYATRPDVILDVSLLSSGSGGSAIYAIVSDFAHNSDSVFVGDPSSLSDEALIRRTENMLSSAIKWGTTNHLAPHPRQLVGNPKLGIAPMTWEYGNHSKNIQSLIDSVLKTGENLGSNAFQFDKANGQFTDIDGVPIGREGIYSLAEATPLGSKALAGGGTLARHALIRSLLQDQGGRDGVRDGRPHAVLEALGDVAQQHPDAVRGVFYARNPLKMESVDDVINFTATKDLKQDLGDAIDRGDFATAYVQAKDPNERKKLLSAMGDRTIELFADSKIKVSRWIQGLPLSDNTRQSLEGNMRRSDTVRSDLEKEIKDKFTDKMFDAITKAAKASKMTTDQAKKMAGFWVTAKYAPEASAQLVQKDRTALLEAQVKGDPLAIALAQKNLNDRILDVGGAIGQAKVRGVGGGMNNAEAAQIISNVESKIDPLLLAAIAQPIYDMMTWKKEKDLAAGKVTQTAVNSWLNSPRYVPLTGDPRFDRESTDVFSAGGQLNQDADKEMNGRKDSVADDGIDASFTAVLKSINFSAMQDFKRSLNSAYEAATAAGQDIGLTREPVTGIVRTGDDVVIYRDATTSAQGQQSMVAHAFKFKDQRIIEALRKDNQEHLNTLLKVLSSPTRWYARAVTQFMPMFAPINLVRDIWERSEVLRTRKLYDASGGLVDVKKVARQSIANTIDRDVWRATIGKAFKTGGTTTTRGDLEEMVRLGGVSTWGGYLQRSVADVEAAIRGHGSAAGAVTEKVLSRVEAYNEAFEMVPSLAIYRALKAEGMTPEDAAAAVLDLMNFRKKGTMMPAVKALYVFAQPAAQGGYNLAQYLNTRTGKVRFATQALIATAMYAFLKGAWGDDEDEEMGNKLDNLSNFTVERSLPIKLGDYVLKVPVGFGPPQLAWAMGGIVNRLQSGRYSATDAAGEMAKVWVKSFSAVAPSDMEMGKRPVDFWVQTFTPTVLKPLFNIYADQTSFGAPLTPSFKNPDKLKSEQAKRTTAPIYTEIAKQMHDTLGVDMYPDHIKALADGVLIGPMQTLRSLLIENEAKKQRGEPGSLPLISSLVDTINDRAILNTIYYRVRGDMEKGHRETASMLADPERRGDVTGDQRAAEREYQRFMGLEKMLGAERAAVNKQKNLDEDTRSERIQRIESRADEAHRKLLVGYFRTKAE